MKIQFLGTGAPDWKRAVGFIRKNTALLINDDLLIDPGPDVPEMMAKLHRDPSLVRFILVSHNHGDHFSSETMKLFPEAMVYGSETLAASPDCPARFTLAESGKTLQVGNYVVIPALANHQGTDVALHYSIRSSDASLFYGHDGVWYTSDEFAILSRECVESGAFDCILFDTTVNGMGADGKLAFFDHFEEDDVSPLELTAHNNAAMAIALREVCLAAGIADAHTDCVCNHLAWHGFPDMETPRRVFEPHGFIVPFDGMAMEWPKR